MMRCLYTDSLPQPHGYIFISRLPVRATILVSLCSCYLSLVALIVEALHYQAPHHTHHIQRTASEVQLRRHRVEIHPAESSGNVQGPSAGTTGAMAVNSRRSAICSGISGRSQEWRPNLRVHDAGQSSHGRLQGTAMSQRENARGRIVARALMTASKSLWAD